jgi:hypothetical protein
VVAVHRGELHKGNCGSVDSRWSLGMTVVVIAR